MTSEEKKIVLENGSTFIIKEILVMDWIFLIEYLINVTAQGDLELKNILLSFFGMGEQNSEFSINENGILSDKTKELIASSLSNFVTGLSKLDKEKKNEAYTLILNGVEYYQKNNDTFTGSEIVQSYQATLQTLNSTIKKPTDFYKLMFGILKERLSFLFSSIEEKN